MIKVIVFDFAGVIGPGALMGWVKKHTTSRNLMLERMREKSHLWDLGKVSEGEFLEIISDITGVEKNKVWDTIWGTAIANEELRTLIEKLKKKYKIVLFSDNFAPYLHKQIDLLEVRSLFDEIIISSDHGLKKTDRQFFTEMLEIIGHKEEEVVFTDDSLVNIEIAREMKIASHLFTSVSGFVHFLEKLGVAV